MPLEMIDPWAIILFPPTATRPIPVHANERVALVFSYPAGRDLRSILVRWIVGNASRYGRGCVQVIVTVAHSCSGPVAQVDRAAAF
jgi:hypothetical protein